MAMIDGTDAMAASRGVALEAYREASRWRLENVMALSDGDDVRRSATIRELVVTASAKHDRV